MVGRGAFTCAAVFAALVPAAHGATAGGRATTVAPPAPGIWKLTGDLDATFTVTSGVYVTGFHGTITSTAETSCRTGTVRLPGRLKISHLTGSYYNKPYNEYAVGQSTPSSGPQAVAAKVTLAGHTYKGQIVLSFLSRGAADIWYTTAGVNGGACELESDVHRG